MGVDAKDNSLTEMVLPSTELNAKGDGEPALA